MGSCRDNETNIAENSKNPECSDTCYMMNDDKAEDFGVQNSREMSSGSDDAEHNVQNLGKSLSECNLEEELGNCEMCEENSKVANVENGDTSERETPAGSCDLQEENLHNSKEGNKDIVQDLFKEKRKKCEMNISKKKSKNQIKEERLKIYSETHRLMREREIAIPYHVPKQRTLREFLARKKNRANIPLNTPSSKMLEIWKDIEESTRSAFEFFKSDSDSDCESSGSKEKAQLPKTEKDEISPDCGNSNSSSKFANIVLDINDGNSNINNEMEGSLEENSTQTADSEKNTHERANIISNNGEKLISSEENNFDDINDKNNAKTNITLNNEKEGSNIGFDDHNILKQKSESSIKNVCAFANNMEESSASPCTANNLGDLKTLDESSVDMKYIQQRTTDWVKSIPVAEKVLRQNKKESLLQKLNPKLLTMTPKLSGGEDSFIDLENINSSIEAGAKNLKKRFIENCVAPRKKGNNEQQITITLTETNDAGNICNVTCEKLIYNSEETYHDPSLDKPGAKLQRLREELRKKIEEKWEEEYKKKALEQKAISENDKRVSDDDILDDELVENVEDSASSDYSDSSDEESEPEEDGIVITENRKKKNQFIDNEAEESELEDEESGNEGGDEYDDEDSEHKTCLEDNANSDFQHSNMSFDKVGDEFLENAYNDSQSSLIPPYQPGGGMLHGGSDLTQSEGDSSMAKNILTPALALSLDFSPASKNNNNNAATQESWNLDLDLSEETNKKVSFVPSFAEAGNFDLSDAYEFCSGKFPDDDAEVQCTKLSENDSQDCVSRTGSNSGIQLTSEIPSDKNVEGDKCDGDPFGGKKKRYRLKVVSDDSEDEVEVRLNDNDFNDVESITGIRISSEESDNDSEKDKTIKSRRKRKNLQFSDDEENAKGNKQETEESDEENEEEDEENEENVEEEKEEEHDDDSSHNEQVREIEYDSEEQEINPGEFFEKEAELSGSEWSGDEDEKGLDNFEEEDGDADKLDEKKVRSQLEKIHMRTLLDDDAREVRLLQELLFEDGDLFEDGPKREKNFRWKHLGAFFDDDKADDENKSQIQDELEEDEQSTKIRHEKELFLLQLKSKKDEMGLDDDDDEDEDGKSMLKLGKIIFGSSKKTVVSKSKAPRNGALDLDEIAVKTPFGLTNNRGSFLSRNEEFLSRLAKFTSNATDNILGPKHSKNFVFASKSPEKENPSKENSHPKRRDFSPNSEVKMSKKVKLDLEITSSRTSIFDRLA